MGLGKGLRDQVLGVNIFVQTLYGLVFMVAFHAPESLSEETEQRLYCLLDGVIKIFYCVPPTGPQGSTSWKAGDVVYHAVTVPKHRFEQC